MKRIILLLVALNSSLLVYSTGHFRLRYELAGSIQIKLNSQVFTVDSNELVLKTNYPAFDTLTFLSESNHLYKVICNFKPDSGYSIVLACCATLDIIQSNKLESDSLTDLSPENIDKIQAVLCDQPSISLRLSETVDDTIFGWYADMACFSKYRILNSDSWLYGVPEKCFYWSNLNHFVFFKYPKNYLTRPRTLDVIEDYPDLEKMETLSSITVRLFDNNSYTLTYDIKANKVIVSQNE